jgi:replicative DNA helicase
MAATKPPLQEALARVEAEIAAASEALGVEEIDFARGNLAAAGAALRIADTESRRNGAAPATGNAAEMPHNLEAEEAVLGALMLSGNAIDASRRAGLEAPDFFRDSHRLIYGACCEMRDRSEQVESITLAAVLEANGALKDAGGKERIHELAALVPSSANAGHYARIVRRLALERRLRLAFKVEPLDRDRIEAALDDYRRGSANETRELVLDGADWLENVPATVTARWGKGDVVLWAEGEPLMLYGPDGVGKTSIGQQLLLHLVGARTDDLLGLPVQQAEGKVLYIAADRPKQARRSLHRMLPEADYQYLRDRLLIWEGPLPFSLVTQPRGLLEFCRANEASHVMIDSLKDIAVSLSDEETAGGINQSFQFLNANGVDLCVMHHPRKEPAGAPSRPKSIEDIYGNRLITASFGSVLLIWGAAGDPVVSLSHIKQPSEEYGPKRALHDHVAGRTTLYLEARLEDLIAKIPGGITALNAASHLYQKDDPSHNDREKARRRLEKLVAEGFAERREDADGGHRYVGK